jgi:hypothetical protein
MEATRIIAGRAGVQRIERSEYSPEARYGGKQE